MFYAKNFLSIKMNIDDKNAMQPIIVCATDTLICIQLLSSPSSNYYGIIAIFLSDNNNKLYLSQFHNNMHV